MAADKKIIHDSIKGWNKDEQKVVLESGDTWPVSDAVLKHADSFEIGKEYEISIYGDPAIVRYITFPKSKDKTTTEKPLTEAKDKKPLTAKEQGWILIAGKKYATLKVLLDKAHEVYNQAWSYQTKIIHLDVEKKVAIAKARVWTP